MQKDLIRIFLRSVSHTKIYKKYIYESSVHFGCRCHIALEVDIGMDLFHIIFAIFRNVYIFYISLINCLGFEGLCQNIETCCKMGLSYVPLQFQTKFLFTIHKIKKNKKDK